MIGNKCTNYPDRLKKVGLLGGPIEEKNRKKGKVEGRSPHYSREGGRGEQKGRYLMGWVFQRLEERGKKASPCDRGVKEKKRNREVRGSWGLELGAYQRGKEFWDWGARGGLGRT